MMPRLPGDDSDASHSPTVSRRAAEALLDQLEDAVSKGATLPAGGEIVSQRGAYFAPAVLTDVTQEMRAYHEELFGPVAVVYRVSSDADAIALANAVDFGLGGAVFSTDEERAGRVAAQLEVGMASVNAPAAEGPDLPFGGTNAPASAASWAPSASTSSSANASSTSSDDTRQPLISAAQRRIGSDRPLGSPGHGTPQAVPK